MDLWDPVVSKKIKVERGFPPEPVPDLDRSQRSRKRSAIVVEATRAREEKLQLKTKRVSYRKRARKSSVKAVEGLATKGSVDRVTDRGKGAKPKKVGRKRYAADYCKVEGCLKYPIGKGGRCVSHGGKKSRPLCKEPGGCDKYPQLRGLCRKHSNAWLLRQRTAKGKEAAGN